MANLAYDLETIRNKMRKKKGGSRDPNEWRPDKAEQGKPLKWKFFILPPVDSMDLWYYEHGAHWIENKVLECPRIHGDDSSCPLCQFGFDMMKETDDKEERRKIARNYLASSRYAVNIYFPSVSSTPADLRGKVMWFSMPQSVYTIMEEVIMRDPPESDALEPEPYGIFFDPTNALPFVLEAKKKGEFNSYESSHFINKPMPITKKEEKIEGILESRHDIPSLFSDRDLDALQSIVDNLTGSSSTKSAPKAEPSEQIEEEQEEEVEVESGSDLEDELEEDEIEEKAEEPKAKAKKEKKEAKIEVEDDDLNSLLEELNSD